jgi:hypothetical protein
MVRTNDGQTLRAIEAEDIVAELNDLSFTPEDTPGQFMTASAGRILAFSGAKIRTDNAANYVADLFSFGFLTTDEEPLKGKPRAKP